VEAEWARLLRTTSHGESLEVILAPGALAQQLVLYVQLSDAPPLPPASMASRHSVRVAAVTRYLRLVDSRSAPRSRSSNDARVAFGRLSGPYRRGRFASVARRCLNAGPETERFVLDILHVLPCKSVSNEIVLRETSRISTPLTYQSELCGMEPTGSAAPCTRQSPNLRRPDKTEGNSLLLLLTSARRAAG
jgi:hypothetical protein